MIEKGESCTRLDKIIERRKYNLSTYTFLILFRSMATSLHQLEALGWIRKVPDWAQSAVLIEHQALILIVDYFSQPDDIRRRLVPMCFNSHLAPVKGRTVRKAKRRGNSFEAYQNMIYQRLIENMADSCKWFENVLIECQISGAVRLNICCVAIVTTGAHPKI